MTPAPHVPGAGVRLEPPREAAPEDLAEIAALLSRVLPRALPWEPDLAWRYLGHPRGRARYANARSSAGALVAHYALMPCPPVDDPRFASLRVFFALNVAVRPDAGVPGLMVATARALFEHVAAGPPALILAVGNENSSFGLCRLLGFRRLGRLALSLHAPPGLPGAHAPRALCADESFLRWRVSRPGVVVRAAPGRGALLRRIRHAGLPLDAVLSVGLPGEALARLDAAGSPRPWLPAAPRLYAGFGAGAGGVRVPDWLRPSPLEYMFRLTAPDGDAEALAHLLATRRFEFIDFDVV